VSDRVIATLTAPGFVRQPAHAIERGNFSEKFRFYGEIFTIIFPRAASDGKIMRRLEQQSSRVFPPRRKRWEDYEKIITTIFEGISLVPQASFRYR